MRSAGLALLLVFSACSDSKCPPLRDRAGPMTPDRARQIAPDVTTGLGLSTTHAFGDCRPTSLDGGQAASCGEALGGEACAEERAPLRVLVFGGNASLPKSEACGGAFLVEAIAPLAVADATSSADGELVLALSPGRYRVVLSRDDHCAACGALAAGEACIVDVAPGAIATRDLVLDRASR